MPAIADQVAALEHDHDDALAMIDTLTAANAALMDALNAAAAEKAALEAKLAELRLQADAVAMMAEKFANSALDVLKAARLPASTPVEVIPFAPRPKALVAASDPPGAEAIVQVLANDAAPPTAPAMSPEPDGAPMIESATAVELIKRRLLPALTLMRRPVEQPTRVRHDPSPIGLPMFLRRDTVFARAAAYG